MKMMGLFVRYHTLGNQEIDQLRKTPSRLSRRMAQIPRQPRPSSG